LKLGPVRLPLTLPALDVPRLGLAAFRRRIIFHAVFLLLALATLALAVALLTEEKQRNAQRYEQGFRRSLAEIVAQLRHPAGQLALLNPQAPEIPAGWVAPLLLPFSAIDFDDQAKAQRAVEMAGCARQYTSGASLCAAIGSNAYAGGFIYLVASFDAPTLVGRARGALVLADVHRARITLQMRGGQQHWIAPLELLPAAGTALQRGQSSGGLATLQRGQLAGFATDDPQGLVLVRPARPQRDFRGWLWREGPCAVAVPAAADGSDCLRRAYVSIRLPVEAFREALFRVGATPEWPPADLPRIGVRLELLSPQGQPALFDSATPGAQPPLSLDKVGAALAPGETLRIQRLTPPAEVVAVQRGVDEPGAQPSPWLTALIHRLPSTASARMLQASEVVVTPAGRFEVRLTGDLQSLDRTLSASATRLAWPVGAMLVAIALAWLIIEMGLIRRVAVLTKRAAALSYNIQDARAEARIGELEVADLRGPDELGILAGSLADLLQRVKDGLRREQLRAERERDMWHAVGHEIMSPLQSLMVLHGQPSDASHRYVQRMQQAVRVLYGTASPGEAIESATLEPARLDLDAFLQGVAGNAHYAGIDGVVYAPAPQPVTVHADTYSLEDAVTHVLRNAQRYRPPGTPITLRLQSEGALVRLAIHNQGPHIAAEMLEKIFEYGVSDGLAAGGGGEHRGQGLFVAKTYLAKMDGTITARNVDDGVVFELGLRASA
jgi:signal transduction histidine kinase